MLCSSLGCFTGFHTSSYSTAPVPSPAVSENRLSIQSGASPGDALLPLQANKQRKVDHGINMLFYSPGVERH